MKAKKPVGKTWPHIKYQELFYPLEIPLFLGVKF